MSSRQRNKKICVICGRPFECRPSRNIVTCGPECRAEYSRRNHTGYKYSPESRVKMSKIRLENPRCADLRQAATRAAQNSPRAGKFVENVHAIDWHLISPDGRHFRFRSLREWLRKNGKKFFDVEPNTRQFDNVFYGLSRVKKSMLGNLPPGQRPGYTYKGWRVIPTEYDMQKNNGLKN